MTDQQRTSAAGSPAGYSMATFAEAATLGGKAEIEGLSLGVEAYRRKWDAVNTRPMMASYSIQHTIPDAISDVQAGYAEYQRSFSRFRMIAGARYRPGGHCRPGGRCQNGPLLELSPDARAQHFQRNALR